MKVKNTPGLGGIWGLKCWRSESEDIISYLPSLCFLFSYFFIFNQLSSIAFPSRAKISIALRWVICLMLLSHAVALWKQAVYLLDCVMEFYVKDQPYIIQINFLQITLPIFNVEYTKIFVLIVFAMMPLLLNFLFIKQRQRLGLTWFDIRRRYRNELGSGHYYLARPCTPLEDEKGQKASPPLKVRSEELVPAPPTVTLPPRPKTA